MLRSFRLANHKSIRQEQELLLLPVYDDASRPAQTVSAIYGANASGKSTLLDGLLFMRQAIRDSYGRWEPDERIPRTPFRLDRQARTEPSTFVVDLDLDGVRHTYGFSIDDTVVREEWLHSYPERKRRVIFERSDDIKIGSTVTAPRNLLGALEELSRPDVLLLSIAGRTSLTESRAVYDWFRTKLAFRVSRQTPAMSPLAVDSIAKFAESTPRIRQTIVSLLKFADVGISDIAVRETGDEDPPRKSIFFIHSSPHDPFDIRDESAGTRAWLDILRVALIALDRGATLFVDEIDTSLHPRLTARLLALFQDEATNPNQAQLVCTTHDTTLLSPTLGEQVLKRDQVWFTEKNEAGETSLYPLSDFKPRKGENTERRYLGGSYGAVPRIFPEDFATVVRESAIGKPPDDPA